MPEFRPDTFFEGRWVGWAITRDLAGKVRDRYTIEGEGGAYDARRHFRLREQYAFADGRTDSVEWEIVTDDQGVFAGRDVLNGVDGVGRQIGDDYIWRFNRRVPTAIGEMPIRFVARYHAVTEDQVVATTSLKRWGLPIATIEAAYERVEKPPSYAPGGGFA